MDRTRQHRGSDARHVAEWTLKRRPRVAWFRIPCCFWDGCNSVKTLSGRRMDRRLIRNCVALMRFFLSCVNSIIVWRIWRQNTHGWSDQSMNQVWTTLLHHVRIDGCMCGLRESEKGDLVSRPWRIQSNFAHVKEGCRGLRCSHPYRHERCPEDSARCLCSRPLVRRAAQGILRSERTAEELIGWLSEESFVMNPQNLEVDTSSLTDSHKSKVDTSALTDSKKVKS